MSIWTRVRAFFRPERETYETRKARGAGVDGEVPTQRYPATDDRRHGGSGAIGA